jgi:hypothetical protein
MRPSPTYLGAAWLDDLLPTQQPLSTAALPQRAGLSYYQVRAADEQVAASAPLTEWPSSWTRFQAWASERARHVCRDQRHPVFQLSPEALLLR